MVCRLALRNLVVLQNPVTHPLICHKPGMKAHQELWCYEYNDIHDGARSLLPNPIPFLPKARSEALLHPARALTASHIPLYLSTMLREYVDRP